MTAHLLARIVLEAGLPPGRAQHRPRPRAEGGRRDVPPSGDEGHLLHRQHPRPARRSPAPPAPLFKKLSLEMGGKNPMVIFADATSRPRWPPRCARRFANQGQICLCGPRIFVERSVYERFEDALVERTRALKLGDPLDARDRAGRARVAGSTCDKVLSYLALAREEGGRFLTGGRQRAAAAAAARAAGSSSPRSSRASARSAAPTRRRSSARWRRSSPSTPRRRCSAGANGTRYGLAAIGVDARPRPGAPLRRGAAERHRLGELLDAARPADAVRRG